jgi:hypothetical protein
MTLSEKTVLAKRTQLTPLLEKHKHRRCDLQCGFGQLTLLRPKCTPRTRVHRPHDSAPAILLSLTADVFFVVVGLQGGPLQLLGAVFPHRLGHKVKRTRDADQVLARHRTQRDVHRILEVLRHLRHLPRVFHVLRRQLRGLRRTRRSRAGEN